MRYIAISLACLILMGCVQNSYERPYMISHEKIDEAVPVAAPAEPQN